MWCIHKNWSVSKHIEKQSCLVHHDSLWRHEQSFHFEELESCYNAWINTNVQKGKGEMIYDFSLCPLSVIASECLWWCQKKVLVLLSKASLGSITRIICLQVMQFQFLPYSSLNISLKHMVPRTFECNKGQGMEST